MFGRHLVLLGVVVASSGCDLAFSLDRPVFQTVCGTFGGPHEVGFGDELTDVTDLSFNGDGTRGFVRGTTETSTGPRTGPLPVRLDGDRWVYDAAFEANWRELQDNLRVHVGRISRDNELFVAQQLTSPSVSLNVFHYGFSSGNWQPLEATPIARSSNADSIPGGELQELVPGSNPPVSFDFLPIFRFDTVTLARTVGIAVHAPNATEWEDQERIGGVASTDTLNEQHQPWSGALARTPEGRQVLIYAATPDGSSENSDLFIAEKRSGGYTEGVPIDGFNSDDEEVEPWVSEDCSVITFRRTARGAPFDGEARSGGTIYMSTLQ